MQFSRMVFFYFCDSILFLLLRAFFEKNRYKLISCKIVYGSATNQKYKLLVRLSRSNVFYFSLYAVLKPAGPFF